MDWQCCLVGSSKTAPRIFNLLFVLGADYLSYVKSIPTFAPTFYGYIISVLASVETQAFYIINRPNCVKICNTVYLNRMIEYQSIKAVKNWCECMASLPFAFSIKINLQKKYSIIRKSYLHQRPEKLAIFAFQLLNNLMRPSQNIQ